MTLQAISNLENYITTIIFGCVAIIYNLLFLVLGIIFVIKKTDLNYTFGYRSAFALSSANRWRWCNKVFFFSVFITQPIFLIMNVAIFIVSLIYTLSFAWIVLSFAISIAILIPISLFVEIYGRRKFKDEDIGEVKPLIENEQSKKQDIDEFFS